MDQLGKKQKYIIISICFVILAIFISLFFIKPVSKYGNGVSVNNYDKYTPNLPTDRRDSINTALYKITKSNLNNKDINIKDAVIRKEFVEYNYNKSTDINSGSFIVDMQSIKQSYLISYEWSSDNNNVNLSGYSAVATCLPVDKLIYGIFNCVDSFSGSVNNIKRDPILNYLPYSTFNYVITANMNSKNKVDLVANIILYSSDTRDGNRDNSISKYETEITNWINSKGLNPNDYFIDYIIN